MTEVSESRKKDKQISHGVLAFGGRLVPSRGVIEVVKGAAVQLCSCTGGEDGEGREFMVTLQWKTP